MYNKYNNIKIIKISRLQFLDEEIKNNSIIKKFSVNMIIF